MNNALILSKSEFIKPGKHPDHKRQYVIVKAAEMDYPIVVYRTSDELFTALLLRCTHQGTELNVAGNVMTCPAHQSEFNSHGEVIQGPANQNLKSFLVSTHEDHIEIHLS